MLPDQLTKQNIASSQVFATLHQIASVKKSHRKSISDTTSTGNMKSAALCVQFTWKRVWKCSAKTKIIKMILKVMFLEENF